MSESMKPSKIPFPFRAGFVSSSFVATGVGCSVTDSSGNSESSSSIETSVSMFTSVSDLEPWSPAVTSIPDDGSLLDHFVLHPPIPKTKTNKDTNNIVLNIF